MKVISSYEEFSDAKAKQPWLLLFVSASWCGPCQRFNPIVSQVGQKFEKILTTLKVDAEEVPQISTEYGIRSVPTLLLFHNGKVVEGAAGLQSPEDLMNWLTGQLLVVQ